MANPLPITLRAGRQALELIREHGLKPSMVGLIPGAAGGPKALGLHGLDCAIFGHWLPQAPRQRWLVGASAGAWRFAALAQPEPIKALKRFAELYIAQQYSLRPTMDEISHVIEDMIIGTLDGNEHAIVNNPQWQLAILTVRSKGLLASDSGRHLAGGFLQVITNNLRARPRLAKHFERIVLHSPGAQPPFFPLRDFPTEAVTLTPHNLKPALLASGAIPGLVRGVTNLPGAGPGTYRDGGLLDYHLDLPFSHQQDIVLYPHFVDRIIPGWFDKSLPWRKPNPAHLDNMLLIAPSLSYLSTLPRRRLPDRSDFRHYVGRDSIRQRNWRLAISESERMGDAFLSLVESSRLMNVITPL